MMVNKNHAEKAQRSNMEYIERLEEERRKIQVFHRELPLSLELVSQAIETCRKEMTIPGKSESFEHTSEGGPIFNESIPVKNTSFFLEDEQLNKNRKGKNIVSSDNWSNDESTKLDWLKSAQLWQHTPDQPADKDSVREVPITRSQNIDSGGAFKPFKKDKRVESAAQLQLVTTPNVNSTAESGGNGDRSSKPRRCWSPYLHGRFVAAVEELGGAYEATPKQIMEKMKVDGLTNDEVKSHLQKYRFHVSKISSSSTQETQTQRNVLPLPPPPQTAPQFVLVGGLWVQVQPPEYACMVARTPQPGDGTETTMLHSPPNGIYAPKPLRVQPPKDEAMPFLKKRKQSSEFQSTDSPCCHHKGRYGSDSSATSSSTHTTTASHVVQLLP